MLWSPIAFVIFCITVAIGNYYNPDNGWGYLGYALAFLGAVMVAMFDLMIMALHEALKPDYDSKG